MSVNLNEIFKSVLNADRAAVVICDLEHTIIYMNPVAVARYEKWGGKALLGKSLLDCHNEKSREMYGEYLRWMDLARTKTLEKRLYFNDQAYGNPLTDITGRVSGIDGYQYVSRNNTGGFQPNKHYYRPIPLSFLDKLTKEGKPLSESEKAELQNPGY